MEYILKISKFDKRCKAGMRVVGTYSYDRPDAAAMFRECTELRGLYPAKDYLLEYHPKYKTVKNLMTGQYMAIPWDTPRSCDPSTELYWSM